MSGFMYIFCVSKHIDVFCIYNANALSLYLRIYLFLFLNFSVPPQNVWINGPSSITTGHGHKIKISCQSDIGNPAAQLSYKIFEMTSSESHIDILSHLVSDNVVELQEANERFINRQADMTENNNSDGNTGYITTKNLLIHPRIVKKVNGNQIKIQCLSNHKVSDELLVEMIRK